MSQRLAPIVVPVCVLGLVSVVAAGASFAGEAHSPSMLFGVAALLIASTLASHFPVPIEPALDDHHLRADGLGRARPRRALAAVAAALGRARRAAARDRPLPALDVPGAARDAACADRPADGPRQPPPLPGAAGARAD